MIVIGMAWKYLSLVCFLFALRYAIKVFYDPLVVAADFLPLASLLFLPVFGNFTNLCYDYALLAFFALCLGLMAARRWTAYYTVYVLSILNKETAILLPLIFAVGYWKRMERRRYSTHLALQGGLYVFVMAFLVWLLRNRPGGLVELHLSYNLRTLADVRTFFEFERIGSCLLSSAGFSIPIPVGPNLLVWGPASAMTLLGWRRKPHLLRAALPICFVLLGGFALFFGLTKEIRALYEAFVVAFLLMVGTFARIWDVPVREE